MNSHSEDDSVDTLRLYEDQMAREDKWFQANRDRLRAEHGCRKYVCVFYGQVAAVGESIDDVMRKMERKVGQGSMYVSSLADQDTEEDDVDVLFGPPFVDDDDEFSDLSVERRQRGGWFSSLFSRLKRYF